MIQLLPNTAAQVIYMTLKEKVKDLPTFTNYLIEFKSQQSQATFRIIANVNTENVRYTKIDIGTDTDDAINGSIQIVNTGFFGYTVYGQNSETNLDPEDAAVVGTAEIGLAQVLTQEAFYNLQGGTVPANVIYYE
tara:strand:- start:31 stop:435 length:405 start_codon:yes stop_codon:yes gene_type:complete